MDWIKIIDSLDWNNDETEILAAKNELMKIPDESIHLLVQPLSKYHWENAADVIVSLGIDRCKPILNEILKWLQDLNWPGAMKVFSMLKNCKSRDIDSYLAEAINLARVEKDDEWLENINMLIETRNEE